MRHLKKGRKLNRTSAHRKAMLRNMSISLIRHGAIRTTLPKAKELRTFVEPLITLGKKDTLAHRRKAFSLLGNKEAVGKLFTNTSKICAERPGGYLSILKAGIRAGDKSTLALVRIMDIPDDYGDTGSAKSNEVTASAAGATDNSSKMSKSKTNDKAKPESDKSAERIEGKIEEQKETN